MTDREAVPEWLLNVCERDPHANAIVHMAQLQGWSFDRMMRALVEGLAEHKAALLADFVTHVENGPPPMVVAKDEVKL